MCWTFAQTLTADVHAPHRARDFVEARLLDTLPVAVMVDVVADAQLVVSELVSNAVHAGCRMLSVSMQGHHGELRIDVTDDGDGWPEAQLPNSDDAHGRGLLLVEALSEDWGVTRTASGKSVWATLTIPFDETSLLTCQRGAQGVSG